MGKLYAVGFGPGGYEHMTAKAIDVIKNADIITGYTTYVEMLKKFFPDKEYVATPMTKEMDRCRMAIDLASEGKTVAMVSSGDSGIMVWQVFCWRLPMGRKPMWKLRRCRV